MTSPLHNKGHLPPTTAMYPEGTDGEWTAQPPAKSPSALGFSSLLLLNRKENVHRHVLRLLLHLHHKVAPAKLESLQKALEPPKQVKWWVGDGVNTSTTVIRFALNDFLGRHAML